MAAAGDQRGRVAAAAKRVGAARVGRGVDGEGYGRRRGGGGGAGEGQGGGGGVGDHRDRGWGEGGAGQAARKARQYTRAYSRA